MLQGTCVPNRSSCSDLLIVYRMCLSAFLFCIRIESTQTETKRLADPIVSREVPLPRLSWSKPLRCRGHQPTIRFLWTVSIHLHDLFQPSAFRVTRTPVTWISHFLSSQRWKNTIGRLLPKREANALSVWPAWSIRSLPDRQTFQYQKSVL